MAPLYLVEGIDSRQMSVPEYLDSQELVMLAETITHNITDEMYLDNSYTLGNHQLMIRVDSRESDTTNWNYIVNCYLKSWFGIVYDIHSLKWRNSQGIEVSELGQANVYGAWKPRYIVTKDTVIENYDNSSAYAKFTEFCNHIHFVTFIYYNTSAYSSMKQAWENHTFWLTQGISFDQVGTSWNAWSLISSLLFFQAPQINPFINLIIALPFWVCIAYLIYRLILLALPFVG